MNPSPPSPSASCQPWFPDCTIHPLPSLPPPCSLEETICPSAKAERCVWKDLPGSLTCYIFNKEDHILALASPSLPASSPSNHFPTHRGMVWCPALHVTRSLPFPKFHKSTPEGCPQTYLFTVPPSSFCFPGLPKLLPAPRPTCHHSPCLLHSSEQSQCWRPVDRETAQREASGQTAPGWLSPPTPGLEAMMGRRPLETAWMAPIQDSDTMCWHEAWGQNLESGRQSYWS